MGQNGRSEPLQSVSAPHPRADALPSIPMGGKAMSGSAVGVVAGRDRLSSRERRSRHVSLSMFILVSIGMEAPAGACRICHNMDCERLLQYWLTV